MIIARTRHLYASRSILRWSPCRRGVGLAPSVRYSGSFQASTRAEDKQDDQILREIFDSAPIWRAFSQTASTSDHTARGLLQNRYLTRPGGFRAFARDIRIQCDGLVAAVVKASSVQELANIPRQLDLLSDSLCRVLDVADFIRAVHPDAAFQDAASQAYAFLWEYMNILNTTPDLKNQLQRALGSPEIVAKWDVEELTVARILLKDFSNSAIDLPQDSRQKFVKLSNEVKRLGSIFLQDMTPAEEFLKIQSHQAKGMEPTLLNSHTRLGAKVSIPVYGEVATKALASIHDEDVRAAIYSHSKTAPRQQITTLENLLRVRKTIAGLSGFESYADMCLVDKMAKSPSAVQLFLNALAKDNATYVTRELAKLGELKAAERGPSSIRPWDMMYYQTQINQNLRPRYRKPDFISAYFSLGTVMQGLSRLFQRLYGIRFVPRQTSNGEVWDSEVRRLDVLHEVDGHVAVLYCDLFARGTKSPNPAHFTLRCSRQISSAELESDALVHHDGMARTPMSFDGQVFQLPTIALICDFPRPTDASSPTLLSFRDVQTLFHEMGHAIHSVLGRTSLQVVSGTRCPTDFAELPSVLMENFAADESVLGLFARHWETDAPLPYGMVTDILKAQRRGHGLHTETQILYSLLDQAYHSTPIAESSFDSTKVFYDIYDTYGNIREPRNISPQAFFGHLVEYGGTYYSYLFDRAIAGKVWRQVFRAGQEQGGIDRLSGEKFKNEVLRWGGSKDPWACIADLLDNPSLSHGGENAMAQVGEWGVHG